MAPALLGAHRHVVCHDCQFAFDCDEQSLPAGLLAICPNCGADNDLESLAALPGERLLVDRAAYARGTPARWDVVVLPEADDPAALCVKRVAGLPGERVEIRAGDLYIDRQLLRKSLPELLALALTVHDDGFRPADPARARWRPEPGANPWRATDEGFECSLDPEPGGAPPTIDWLEYEHQQTHVHSAAGPRVGPILDDLAYNQAEPRELVPVGDVILSCRLAARGVGRLSLRADDGRKTFRVEIDVASGAGELWEGERQIEKFSAPSGVLAQPVDVVFALADARLQFSIGERELVDYRYDPSGLDVRPTARPLAIGAQMPAAGGVGYGDGGSGNEGLGDGGSRVAAGLQVSVSRLRVLRDIYYLPAAEAAGSASPASATAPRTLGADEYWLLGDNSAVSRDSRQRGAASANLLTGKALIHRGAKRR